MRLSFKRGLFDKLHRMINRGKFNPFIRIKFAAKPCNPFAPVEERVYRPSPKVIMTFGRTAFISS